MGIVDTEVLRTIKIGDIEFLAEKDCRFSFWTLELKTKLPKATLKKGSHKFTTFDKAIGFAKTFAHSAKALSDSRKGSPKKEV